MLFGSPRSTILPSFHPRSFYGAIFQEFKVQHPFQHATMEVDDWYDLTILDKIGDIHDHCTALFKRSNAIRPNSNMLIPILGSPMHYPRITPVHLVSEPKEIRYPIGKFLALIVVGIAISIGWRCTETIEELIWIQ